jgi:hypothetical protein
MRTSLFIPIALVLAAGTAAASLWVSSSSFLGAPAGSPIPFTHLRLPPVDTSALGHPNPTLHAVAVQSPWTPTLDQLLTGNTLITSDAEMRGVWRRLFSAPYDASQFDFQNEFVVLMGSEPMSMGSFEISDVEEVIASYTDEGGGGPNTGLEHFLSVTSTTFLPGVQMEDPPLPTYRVSGVTIGKDQFDDVVFHRRLIFGL